MRVLSGKRPVNPPCKRGQRGQIKSEIYSFDHGYAAYLSIFFPSWRVLIYHPDPTEAIGIAKTRVTFIFKFPGYSSLRPAIFFPAISPCSTADGQRPLFTFSRAKKSGACATSPAMLEKARENAKKSSFTRNSICSSRLLLSYDSKLDILALVMFKLSSHPRGCEGLKSIRSFERSHFFCSGTNQDKSRRHLTASVRSNLDSHKCLNSFQKISIKANLICNRYDLNTHK